MSNFFSEAVGKKIEKMDSFLAYVFFPKNLCQSLNVIINTNFRIIIISIYTTNNV